MSHTVTPIVSPSLGASLDSMGPDHVQTRWQRLWTAELVAALDENGGGVGRLCEFSLAQAPSSGAAALKEPSMGLAEALRILASQQPALLGTVPQAQQAREHVDDGWLDNVEASHPTSCAIIVLLRRDPTIQQYAVFIHQCTRIFHTLVAGPAGCQARPGGQAGQPPGSRALLGRAGAAASHHCRNHHPCCHLCLRLCANCPGGARLGTRH